MDSAGVFEEFPNACQLFEFDEGVVPTANRIRLANGPILGERHLRNVLQSHAHYHNQVRTHLSLGKDAPVSRAAQTIGRIQPISLLGGLHHQYVLI